MHLGQSLVLSQERLNSSTEVPSTILVPALTGRSAINYTCFAVDGRKSCTTPLDHPLEQSALLFNTTTSSTHQSFTDTSPTCVHFSLYTTGLGSIASTASTLSGLIIIGILVPTGLFYHTVRNTVTDGLVPGQGLVLLRLSTVDKIQWAASTWHIWRVRRTHFPGHPFPSRVVFSSDLPLGSESSLGRKGALPPLRLVCSLVDVLFNRHPTSVAPLCILVYVPVPCYILLSFPYFYIWNQVLYNGRCRNHH